MTPDNIVLTGFMGTGKTSVGRILSARLHWPLVDTDAVVEELAGRPVPEIIRVEGEPVFRRWEREACKRVAAGKQQVVATGGGALLDPANRATLADGGFVVCLTCRPEEIVHRLEGDDSRPLLDDDPVTRIRQLLDARAKVYDALPHHVDTTHGSPEQVADEILSLWRQA
jgi:shikimate kinase